MWVIVNGCGIAAVIGDDLLEVPEWNPGIGLDSLALMSQEIAQVSTGILVLVPGDAMRQGHHFLVH